MTHKEGRRKGLAMRLEITHYPKHGVLYINLHPELSNFGCIAKTEAHENDTVHLDYSQDGTLYGIDLHDVQGITVVTDCNPPEAAYYTAYQYVQDQFPKHVDANKMVQSLRGQYNQGTMEVKAAIWDLIQEGKLEMDEKGKLKMAQQDNSSQ
jgi:uncharacterized protein YuzE